MAVAEWDDGLGEVVVGHGEVSRRKRRRWRGDGMEVVGDGADGVEHEKSGCQIGTHVATDALLSRRHVLVRVQTRLFLLLLLLRDDHNYSQSALVYQRFGCLHRRPGLSSLLFSTPSRCPDAPSQKCYTSLVENLDIADVECIKFSLSKGLGLGIVVGGAIMKVPQLLLSEWSSPVHVRL